MYTNLVIITMIITYISITVSSSSSSLCNLLWYKRPAACKLGQAIQVQKMCTNTSNVGRIYSSPPPCILRVYSSRVCSIQLVQLDVYAKQMQTTIPNWLLSSLCTCTAQVSVKKGIRRSLSFILTTTLHQWHQSTKYGVCPCSDLFKHCEMATTINQPEIFEPLS